VDRCRDAARPSVDRGADDVRHVHATPDDQLPARALDASRHVRVRRTGGLHGGRVDFSGSPGT
jgi:hypothetical protein